MRFGRSHCRRPGVGEPSQARTQGASIFEIWTRLRTQHGAGYRASGRRRMWPVEPPLLLGGVEVSVFLVECERGELLALPRRERRGPLDAVSKAPGHRTQRKLGVDVQPPRDVDGCEEHVAELLEHVRVRLGL